MAVVAVSSELACGRGRGLVRVDPRQSRSDCHWHGVRVGPRSSSESAAARWRPGHAGSESPARLARRRRRQVADSVGSSWRRGSHRDVVQACSHRAMMVGPRSSSESARGPGSQGPSRPTSARGRHSHGHRPAVLVAGGRVVRRSAGPPGRCRVTAPAVGPPRRPGSDPTPGHAP
jgi:hypothetical protein